MVNLRDKTHLVFLGLVVIALGVGVFYYSNASDTVPGIPAEKYAAPAPTTPPSTPPPTSKPEPIPNTEGGFDIQFAETEEMCTEGGGKWNPCASACPSAEPDELCIQVCVERCEPLN